MREAVATGKPTATKSRRRRLTMNRRFESAGPLTYVFLLLIAILSIFPLYWSVVIASHDNSAIAAYPPVTTPGRELFHNIGRVFNSGEVNIIFWTALFNSAIVAGAIAALGRTVQHACGIRVRVAPVPREQGADARGRRELIVPIQLGVIPLYLEMKHLHWINHLQAVIAPARSPRSACS